MKKRFAGMDLALIALLIACTVLMAALAVVKPFYLLPALAVFCIALIFVLINIQFFRRSIRQLLHGGQKVESKSQISISNLNVPVMVLKNGVIIWYNDTFRTEFLDEKEAVLIAVGKVIPGFLAALAKETGGQNISHNAQRYTVYGSGTSEDDGLFVAYFINDTALKNSADEYSATRPSVMIVTVDTYDEIIKELKESERAHILGRIETVMEEFAGETTSFLRRIGAAKYMLVVEEQHLQEIIKQRFSVLDTVRNLGDENMLITLSIGVGHQCKTLCESEAMAVQALDMALGRGGDQVAVKSKEGFTFYGGVSRSIEKRSKVKSRIISDALKDLIKQSTSVLIMGHRISDLDALGAGIGMRRFATICGKPAAVVVDEKKSLAANLVQEFRDAGLDDYFLTPEDALDVAERNTLLIIVDTHMQQMLESPELYKRVKNVVVIDHHRKSVGHIENSVIFYHEPYASSASELVSELLQYLGGEKETRLTALEAQALLAGIMLDTRNFALHTGVRTFEAAAYLRRMGAQTQEVKKLFNSSVESYAYKANLVTKAEIYQGCAVVFSEELPAQHSVVVPQAANDLLTIDGVEASFVAVAVGDQVNISGRSMGAVNVQVILEKLGGGGHLTMAGGQLKNTNLQQAKELLLNAISDYRKNQQKALPKG